MAKPIKFPHRREFQANDEVDAMVNEWRHGTGFTYAEAVRRMIGQAAALSKRCGRTRALHRQAKGA